MRRVERARDRLAPGTRRAVQRTPLNTECKLLLLTHAFEALGCIAVEFRTHASTSRAGARSSGSARSSTACCARTTRCAATARLRDTAMYSITAGRMADGQGAAALAARHGPSLTSNKRADERWRKKEADHGRGAVADRARRRVSLCARRRAGRLLGQPATRWRRTRRSTSLWLLSTFGGEPRRLTQLRREGRPGRAGRRAATRSPSSPSASRRARRTTRRSST